MLKILKLVNRHRIISIVCLGIVALGGYYFLNNSGGDENSNQELEIVKVEKGDIEIVVNGSGQIQAESQVDLKPQIAGDGLDIVEVLVENNQAVKEGDVIAVLDSSEASEKIRDAQLSLSSAQIQYEEIVKEYNNKTLEETWKRDLAQNAVNQKANDLNDAYEDLEEYTVEAPFDGIVTGLNVEAGDSISRDEILASVITDNLQAEISLNEIDAVKVKKGAGAVLTFDVLGEQELKGEVLKIDTIGSVNSGVVSYDVVISFESSSKLLKPGMSVEVDIEIEKSEDALLLPSAAIKESQEGSEYVLVVGSENFISSDAAKPERRTIETGITDDVSVEIKSGLEEGEFVLAGQISKSSKETDSGKTTSLIPMSGGGGGRPRN